MNPEQPLRDQLVQLLDGGMAHLKLPDELSKLSIEHAGEKSEAVPYTAWQLVEHIRIAQWDILEFSRDPKHVSPEFPDGYWPETEAPADRAALAESIARILSDLAEMQALVSDPATDLHARIPRGDGQTILREALLIADHNAYHLGQLVLLRRMRGQE